MQLLDTPDRTDDPLARARRVVLSILTVEVAVLVVTGMALFFVYRPTVHPVFFDGHEILGGNVTWGVRLSNLVRLVHRAASLVSAPTAVALAVLLVVGAKPAIKRWSGALLGGAATIAVMAASFTGTLLPWDQVAVKAVKIGTNMQGYRPLFGDDVRFVILDRSEISLHAIIGWLLIHMLVIGTIVVALVALSWRYVRTERRMDVTRVSEAPSR